MSLFSWKVISPEGLTLFLVHLIWILFFGRLVVSQLVVQGLLLTGLLVSVCSGEPWLSLAGVGIALLSRALDHCISNEGKGEDPLLVWFPLSLVGILIAGAGLVFKEPVLLFFGLWFGNLYPKSFLHSSITLSCSWMVFLNADPNSMPTWNHPMLVGLFSILFIVQFLLSFHRAKTEDLYETIPSVSFTIALLFSILSEVPAGSAWWIGSVGALGMLSSWVNAEPIEKKNFPSWLNKTLWVSALVSLVGFPVMLMGQGASLAWMRWQEGESYSFIALALNLAFAVLISKVWWSTRNLVLEKHISIRAAIGQAVLMIIMVPWVLKETGLFWTPEFSVNAISGVTAFLIFGLGFGIAYWSNGFKGWAVFNEPNWIRGLIDFKIDHFSAPIEGFEAWVEKKIWERGVKRATESIWLFLETTKASAEAIGERVMARSFGLASGALKRPVVWIKNGNVQIYIIFGIAAMAVLFVMVWKG